MSSQNDLRTEIISWLKSSQIGEELPNFEIELEGNSEKGDGYIGDIVFARVTGKNRENVSKEYDLVLKCAKRSEALREKTPVREVFENEIEIYKTILPAFQEFERSKGITEVFDCMPRCFGTFQSENMEVLILENLRKECYSLWDAKLPVTAKHNELVVQAYGRWHAIGVALRDQNLKLFQQCASKLQNGWNLFVEQTGFLKFYESNLDDICEKLQGIVDDHTLVEFRKIKGLIPAIGRDFVGNKNYFTTITHGDCWSNNFMYRYQDNNSCPLDVAILDWQFSYLASPILDLGYHLYCSISEDTLENLDYVLILYYTSFSEHLRRLGSDPEKIYPFKQLQEDWKIFAIFGVFQFTIVLNAANTEKDDVKDMAEFAEKGLEMSDMFKSTHKSTAQEIDRLRYIVEHVVKSGLVREKF